MVRSWRRTDKNGSILIFLSFILVSMVALSVTFVINAKEAAEKSYQMAMTDLACRSVLAEYDVRLKDDYGIFAYRGSERYVERKLEYYLGYAERNSSNAFSLSINYMDVESDAYSILDIDVFEDQVITAAKYGFMGSYDETLETGLVNEITYDKDRLPSSQVSEKGLKLDFEGLTSDGLKNIAARTGKTFMVNSYCFQNFRSYSDTDDSDSFFDYEIEYILAGSDSDDDNLAKVRQYFITLRTPINIAKIYADPARSAAALAEAEALTPGPAAPTTQLVIITSWAVKDAEKEWDSVLLGGSVDGLYYNDYLAVFLTLHDREVKLLRMMDLMQLNLQKTYYKGFMMQDLYSGFDVDITIDGRNHVCRHTY